MKYEIAVHGCDDSTYITIELNNDEADLLYRIAQAVTDASEYGCMPTMKIDASDEKGQTQ